jgi:hypothetical protein
MIKVAIEQLANDQTVPTCRQVLRTSTVKASARSGTAATVGRRYSAALPSTTPVA